jgi:HAD superfamily hydrolase (TIGR01490 family)
MNLALFDLDYTLLPIDSDYEWARFLIREGVLDGEHYERENERFFAQYKQGTLDIFEFLRFQLAPLGAHPRRQLDAWHQQYMSDVVAPRIAPQARALVEQHRSQGDLIALVTATNAFVTAPIAKAFGIEHLIATGIEEVNGEFTGKPHGTPSFREGKVSRTEQWLAAMGHRLEGFEQSWFYSDSMNDLPLLEKVTHPVATNPDERLATLAGQRGWAILRLFSDAH